MGPRRSARFSRRSPRAIYSRRYREKKGPDFIKKDSERRSRQRKEAKLKTAQIPEVRRKSQRLEHRPHTILHLENSEPSLTTIMVPKEEVKIRKTNSGVKHGTGVLADQDIPKGVLVCKYFGKVYDSREAAMQDRWIKGTSGTYVFEASKGGRRWIVPGRLCDAKYINSSASKGEINLFSVEHDGSICLCSTRFIPKGTELLLEYNVPGGVF